MSNPTDDDRDCWQHIGEIIERLKSTHEDKIFVAKAYTKGDLRRDLLAVLPEAHR